MFDPSQSNSPLTVTDSASLVAALQAAHAGDTIQLAPGSYSPLSLSGFNFDGTVTIRSADSSNPAMLNGLSLNADSGLAFDHLNLAVVGDSYGAVVASSSNIALSAMTVHGTSDVDQGVGILVRDSSGVTVTGSDLSHIGSGIGLLNDNGLTLSNNTIHDVQSDGIFGSGTSNLVISGNQLQDFHPVPGDHPDAIQLWGGDNGVSITDNVITRGDGDVMQGIFVEYSQNLTIAGNAMAGTMYNGISLSGSSNAQVTGNFVEGYSDMVSWIIVRGQSSDVMVSGNTAQEVVDYQDGGLPNPGYAESGNAIIAGASVGDLSAIDAWLLQHSGTSVAQAAAPPVAAPVVDDPTVNGVWLAQGQASADPTTGGWIF